MCEKAEGMVNPEALEDSQIEVVPSVAGTSKSDLRPQATGLRIAANMPVQPTITVTVSKTSTVKVQKITLAGQNFFLAFV